MWVTVCVSGLDLTLLATLAGEPLLTPGLHTQGPHSSPQALQTPPPAPPKVRQASPRTSGTSPKRLLPLGPPGCGPWVGSPCPCCAPASTQTGSGDLIPPSFSQPVQSSPDALTPWFLNPQLNLLLPTARACGPEEKTAGASPSKSHSVLLHSALNTDLETQLGSQSYLAYIGNSMDVCF